MGTLDHQRRRRGLIAIAERTAADRTRGRAVLGVDVVDIVAGDSRSSARCRQSDVIGAVVTAAVIGYTREVRFLLTAVACAAACSAPAPDSEGPSPGGGAPYPMIEPDSALEALAADFNGSCAFARPGPSAAHYSRALRVVADTAVRDSAEFTGGANRIGTIDAGARLAGEGPLAGGRGRGSGYGVVVRDSQGRVCRGYVSASAVEASDARARGRIK